MAKQRKRRRQVLQTDETRSADVLTSVWMLTVVTTLMCELAAMLGRCLLSRSPDSLGIAALFQLMYFSALVIGLISLAMLPAVLKMRQSPPPRGITVFAVVIGAAPLVTRILEAALR